MNARNAGFYADIILLITGLVMLVAFMLLPYATIGTGLELLLSISAFSFNVYGFVLGLSAFLPVAIVVSAAVSLGNSNLSRNLSFVQMAIGIFELFIQLFVIASANSILNLSSAPNSFSGTLALFSIGYWIMFLGAIFLILQVFVPRGNRLSMPSMIPMTLPPMPNMSPSAPMPAPAPAPMPAHPMGIPANAWLVDVRSNQSYQLMRGETRIGRSVQENHIVLKSNQVSRRQAIIREEGMHFVLYEAGSRQRMMVNGNAVQGRCVLNPNDQITFGDVALRFVRG